VPEDLIADFDSLRSRREWVPARTRVQKAAQVARRMGRSLAFILFSPIGCTLNRTLSSGLLFVLIERWNRPVVFRFWGRRLTNCLKRATGHLSPPTANLRGWKSRCCVQASLSGFGVPFSELYELHAIVVFAKLSSTFMSWWSSRPLFLERLPRSACGSNFAFPSKTCFDEWNSRSFTIDWAAIMTLRLSGS